MKKLIIALAAISIIACKEEPKDYVTFSGKITNKNSDSIVLRTRDYSKTISVNDDGTFSDTLKVETGVYNFFDGTESTSVFLKNGYDINMTIDTKMFDETAKYTGNGAEQSNFLAEKSLLEEKLLDLEKLSDLDLPALNDSFTKIETELTEFYKANKNIDTSITNNALKSLEPMLKSYKGYLKEGIALRTELPKGAASPIFENYENYKGGTTSLADLKGKYVYIDIWATWCGPCKAEIPSLKKVESAYHDKNIEFVSISVDNGRGYKADSKEAAAALAKEGWRKMIAEKELGGIQLYADNDFNSEFIKNYKVNGIPRFILIDPDGNIVSADAPRPSNNKLITLLESLDI